MSSEPYYSDESVSLFAGDCRDLLAALDDCSVDAFVTDPPYELTSGKRGGSGVASLNVNSPAGRSRIGTGGFMGKAWDASGIAHDPAFWAECLRVLKPGGHLVAFGGSRTWHRLACAVEDAGFEIRDSIAWLYGSGFPKSLNLVDENGGRTGWGTALKPAFEPIVVGRKPLAGTVAANWLAHGTGAINIDASRTATSDKLGGGAETLTTPEQKGDAGWVRPCMSDPDRQAAHAERVRANVVKAEALGRWPTNVVLDGAAAAELDAQTGVLTSGYMKPETDRTTRQGDAYGQFAARTGTETYGDSGGASRFFPTFHYEAKAPTSERPRNDDGTAHPTVKPLDFMRWLVRLVTPAGGLVCDPFLGSGTTAEACVIEGFRCIGSERDETYLPLIVARLSKPIQPDIFGSAS